MEHRLVIPNPDKMRNSKKLLLFSGVAALMIACATTTQLRKSWSDPSLAGHPSKPFKKVLVLVALNKEIPKRTAEDQLVAEIRNGEAIQAYKYVTKADTSQKELAERLVKDGFDGAIVMRLKGVVQTKTTEVGTPYSNWYGYTYGYGYGYGYGVGVVINAGPSESNRPEVVDVNSPKDYIIETNIYSLEKKMLVWSGTTASMSAKKIEPAMKGIVNTIRKELKKKGLMSY